MYTIRFCIVITSRITEYTEKPKHEAHQLLMQLSAVAFICCVAHLELYHYFIVICCWFCKLIYVPNVVHVLVVVACHLPTQKIV